MLIFKYMVVYTKFSNFPSTAPFNLFSDTNLMHSRSAWNAKKGFTDLALAKSAMLGQANLHHPHIQNKLYQHKQNTNHQHRCLLWPQQPNPFWSCSTNTLANVCTLYRKCKNFHGHNISWVKFSRGYIFMGESSPPKLVLLILRVYKFLWV